MKSLPALRPARSALAILLVLIAPCSATTASSTTNASSTTTSAAAAADAAPSAQDLLRRMAPMAPDDCSPPVASARSADVHDSEDQLFTAVDSLIADRLNGPVPAKASEGEARARSALLDVERSSAEINKSWPSESRFRFQVLALLPAVLVRMSYRDHARIVLFASYDLGKDAAVDPGTKWRPVSFVDPSTRPSAIDLFPLHRGPGGAARFLARVWRSGCAGSIGEDYYGYEWSAGAGQLATQIIAIEGAEGMDDSESTHVGKLSTTGAIVQLPYCVFSSVDTWDNPTLCAADTFDLSRDYVRFVRRIYNFPDLVAVNNAIRHAQARDYPALRAYCASDAVARKLMRAMPPYLHADILARPRAGPARERIVLEDGSVFFTLVKRRGQWLVESFRIAEDR